MLDFPDPDLPMSRTFFFLGFLISLKPAPAGDFAERDDMVCCFLVVKSEPSEYESELEMNRRCISWQKGQWFGRNEGGEGCRYLPSQLGR